MKNKLYNKFKIFEYLTSRHSFKMFFTLLIFMSIFGRFQVPVGMNIFSSIITPFSSTIFHYILLMLFVYNTITTCKMFNEEFDELFIRYQTKKNKIKVIIENIILITTYSLILFFLIYISLMLATCASGQYNVNPYFIPDIIYTIYTLFKIAIIILLFQVINTLLYFLIKEKILIITTLYFIPFYMGLLKNVKKIYNFFPWFHQTLYAWNNMLEDVLSFGICIICLNIIIGILYKIYNRRV